jgi:hypothetical protein
LCSGAAKGTKSPNNVGDISPQLWYSGPNPELQHSHRISAP